MNCTECRRWFSQYLLACGKSIELLPIDYKQGSEVIMFSLRVFAKRWCNLGCFTMVTVLYNTAECCRILLGLSVALHNAISLRRSIPQGCIMVFQRAEAFCMLAYCSFSLPRTYTKLQKPVTLVLLTSAMPIIQDKWIMWLIDWFNKYFKLLIGRFNVFNGAYLCMGKHKNV